MRSKKINQVLVHQPINLKTKENEVKQRILLDEEGNQIDRCSPDKRLANKKLLVHHSTNNQSLLRPERVREEEAKD